MLQFFAARAQLMAEVLLPAQQRGEIIVCDRFTDSTRAYQGFGRGVPLDVIDQIADALNGPRPDLTVLLDLPAADGLKRACQEGATDRFEGEALAFHERVREGYLTLSAKDPSRWLVIDAGLPASEVTDAIWNRISEMLEDASK
jgi:dTMP kinase